MRQSERMEVSVATTAEMRLMLLRGLVALVLGLSVLLTGKTKPALANYIAVYWLIGSVPTLRWVLRNRGGPGSRAALAAALLGIAAGVVVLLRFLLADLLSTDAVLRLLGVVAILTGLVRLSGAFHDDPVGGDRRLPRSRAVLASLELALGTLLLLTPGSVEATAMAVALWGLVAGTVLLSDTVAMRREAHPGRLHGPPG